MNKTKLINFIKQQMSVHSEFIEIYKKKLKLRKLRIKRKDEIYYTLWLAQWGMCSDLLQMIERGDFDDNHSN